MKFRVSCRISTGSNRTTSKVKAMLSSAHQTGVIFSRAKDVNGYTDDPNILAKLKALHCSKIIITEL